MEVITVQDLIEALKRFPKNTPVFGYSVDDEGDFPIHIIEYTSDVNYCQGDSYVEEYFDEYGEGKVIYLKKRS